jgi:transcriptional regulator with XRE-family HTH domain
MMFTDSPAARVAPQHNLALAMMLQEAFSQGVYAYQVAQAAGISPAYLSLIVRGRREPPAEVARAIADALSVPVRRVFPDA